MINNKKDYKFYLAADLASNNYTTWRWHFRFREKIMYFQRMLRKTEYYQNCYSNNPVSKIYLYILKWKFEKLSIQLGFTIPLNVFGPGLSLAHYGSIIVNEKAKVGKNCRIHSETNIGEVMGKVPVIGDNVYIAPGAKLYGSIKIGNNVAIGANAVVNKDVPDNVTVAGVPAKIISKKGSQGLLIDGCYKLNSRF